MRHLPGIVILITIALNLMSDEIEISQIKLLAERNARQIWGEVNSYEPIPYYNREDEIIAWRFNFSLGEEFYTPKELQQICRDNYQQKHMKNSSDGSYGRMLVGADTDYAVFLDHSQCLSQEFSQGWRAEELAEKHVGQPVELEKMYFLNRPNLWYCFSTGTEKVYVKLYPPQRVCSEAEFRQIAAGTAPFCRRSDHSQSWEEYLSGQKTLTRNIYYIDNYEMMPYYDWSYGCAPTSATMALAYWDRISVFSYPNYSMFVQYHYQRYDNLESEWDYQVPNLQRELAIAMETDTLTTGSTSGDNVESGLNIVTNGIYGYDFENNISFTGDHFDAVMSQIIAERPCLVGITDHLTCGVGYNSDTDEVAVHNTWDNTIDWLGEDELIAVVTIVPGGGYGEGINLVHPRGDVGYNSDGEGETFLAGAVYEITWQKDNEYRDHVAIWLSITGNGGFVQEVLVYDAPNNEAYDWVVPAGLNTSTARIGVALYNDYDYQLGVDGSLGNFIIAPGGSIPQLTDDISIVSNREPQYFRFTHSNISWAVIGVRRMVESEDEDWNLGLFSDTSFETELVGSYLGSYCPVDLVVIDGNHAPCTERGVKIYRPLGSGDARVEYEGGNDELYSGTNGPFTWLPTDDVVEMWDVHLIPGHYYIILEPTGGGNANLDMAFFGFEAGTFYGNRLDALAFSNYLGSDVSETISIEITEEDIYGLCVWANDEDNKTFDIRIEQPGTWRGVVSDDWYDPDNWSGGVYPTASLDVVIPAGTPFYPRLVDWGAHCNDMMIMAGAKVEIYNCYLNVHGDLEVRGELEMTSNQAKMIVYQDITWQLGAVADIQTGSAEIWVRGDWFFASNSSIHLDLGYVEFEEDGNSEIICRSDDSYFHHLRIDKNTGSWVANSDNSTYPLIVNGNFHNYENSQFIGHSMNSTIFRGSFNNYPGAHFSYPNGTVRFEGVNQHINLNSGDYFNDLVIAGSVFLDSGIIIEDDLVIESGSLVSDSNTIQITGDWTDEVGFGGFGEGTGIVVFNGYGTQKINGETFATLRINKNNGELRFTTGITYCDDLDWIDGAMRVNGGEFTALDINNTSLDHDLTVTSGMLEIHKSSDYLDINNVLTLEGGEIHIIGASSSDSYWAWSGPVEINISGGVLDYHDTGIRICDDYLLVDNITGGVIRTTGDFTSERADFDIAGGTLELYGDVDAELDMTTGSSLYNLTINKVSVRTETGSEHDIFLQQDSKTGLIIERQRSENVVAVNNLDINGNFTLQHGNLEAPTFMRVAGDWANNAGLDFFDEDNGAVTFDGDQNSHLYSNERFYNLFINKDIVGSNSLYVNSGKTIKVTNTLQVADGILDIEEGVNLFLDNEFRVEEGGTLIFNGLESNPCKVSSSSGFYSFQVQAGSEISAEYTEFEYMNSAGINVMNGASITADKAFNNCTFLNGETGGTLLTIDNAQNLNIYEAAFPSDFLVRGTNVTKNLDQGFVYLYDAQGSFAGEDYDNDSHDRIEWMHRAELEITSVNWSDQEPFAGDDIFCEVTVTNNGLAYSMPCFLDIYYNQVLPPAPMIPGDQYEYIDAIAPAESTLIIFEEISSFTVLQWFSWLQVDTDQIVNEVDEENNIWGADNINWLPIPPVDDLTIGRNMNREGALYLSWYYPIPVTRFAIHGDVIPGFAISQNNLIDNTTSFYYLITPQNEKYFYRVIAVRDSTARTDFIKDKYIPKRIYSSHGSQR